MGDYYSGTTSGPCSFNKGCLLNRGLFYSKYGKNIFGEHQGICLRGVLKRSILVLLYHYSQIMGSSQIRDSFHHFYVAVPCWIQLICVFQEKWKYIKQMCCRKNKSKYYTLFLIGDWLCMCFIVNVGNNRIYLDWN